MYIKHFILVFAIIALVQFGNAQPSPQADRFVSYKVQQGETIYSISHAFGLDQKTLISYNPGLNSGLRAGQELRIPVAGTQAEKQERLPLFLTYKVKKGNTLHYIAKRFDVSVEDILKYNPSAEKGIGKGDVLRIPDKDDLERIKTEQALQPQIQNTTTHTVKANETLFSISKQYGISIVELIQLNPQAGQGLKVGMVLQLSSGVASVTRNQDQAVPNESYFTHLVESGDTFWSLERKFNTTRDDLERINPVLKEGLKAGLRIRIPSQNVPEFEVVPNDESAFTKYTVKRGETIYGIARHFGVSIPALKRVNPVLDYRGLVEGESILIPNEKEVAVEQTEKSPFTFEEPAYNDSRFAVQFRSENLPVDCQPNPQAHFEIYNVGLLLPFYLPANDTINLKQVIPDAEQADEQEDLMASADSFIVRSNRIIYPRSESFVQFYEGVLIALDSLKKAGMNIRLHVYDTNQNKATIQSIINQPEFRSLNLIIGPVFPELQGPVAEFARVNRIPMISPLSAAGDFEQTNPFYFKINPTKEYLIRQTSNYIADEYFDKNLVVLQMGEYQHLPEAQLVNLSREKLFASSYRNQTQQVLFHEYNLPQEGALGLSRILSKEQENVFIIPSETEAQVSVAVTNLNAVAENYPVTLVGLSNFQRYKSIQTEYYHHVRMNLLSPYYVDYQAPVVNRFIHKFRQNFYTDPNQFSFQGYDIAFYFMSALFNYGKDFVNCLPSNHVKLTQGEFYFEKVNRTGGYMNQGLFILDYEPDYSIRLKGITGIPLYSVGE